MPGIVEDALAQRVRRSRPLDRIRQQARRLAKVGELGATVLALSEVRLELVTLVVVERVERVAGREVVEVATLHQLDSLAYFAATGDQSTEKPGLRSTARRNQRPATSRSPRQRSIIPRWKNIDASCVPRRSASFE